MKRLLLFLVVFWSGLGFSTAQSQFQWVKTAGSSGLHDYTKALGFDLQGNVYAAGTYNDSTRFDGTLLPVWTGTTYYGGAFLVKYDANGILLWAKSLRARDGNITGICEISTMAVTPAGEATVFGKFTDSLTIDGQTITEAHGGFGENSSFMAKFDATGQLIWLKSIASRQSAPVKVSLLGNNDLVVTGVFDLEVGFGGSCNLTAWSGLDNATFLARINGSDGSCMWAVRFDESKESRVAGLAVNADKAYIVGAFRDSIRFNSSNRFGVVSPESNAGNRRNLFVAAFNLNDGSFSWAQQIKGQFDWATDITVLSAQVVICGNASGYIKIGEDSTSGGAFVAGLNSTNGNQVWLKKSSKFINKVVRAGSDEFFVLGNGGSGAWGIDTITTPHLGSGFMFAKFNAAGAALFAEGFGTTGATVGVADAAYQDGDLLVGGSAYGFGTVNMGNNLSLVMAEVAYNNLWFGLYGAGGSGTSVQSIKNPLLNAVVYPNPAQDGFTIKSTSEGLISYKLLSLTGAVLLQGLTSAQQFIPTQGLAAGTYLLRLEQNSHFTSRKLVLTP